eukprot:2262636-Amphidinium_carterae.1
MQLCLHEYVMEAWRVMLTSALGPRFITSALLDNESRLLCAVSLALPDGDGKMLESHDGDRPI